MIFLLFGIMNVANIHLKIPEKQKHVEKGKLYMEKIETKY